MAEQSFSNESDRAAGLVDAQRRALERMGRTSEGANRTSELATELEQCLMSLVGAETGITIHLLELLGPITDDDGWAKYLELSRARNNIWEEFMKEFDRRFHKIGEESGA